MPVRILLADDHSVVRHGLKHLLESRKGWKVVAEAADGRSAVAKAELEQPDVAIVDIGMPELNGIEALRQILAVSPRTGILVLSAHRSEGLARQTLEAGGQGYLVKDDADEELLDAVEAVKQHKQYFSSQLGDWAARRKTEGSRSRGELTAREREIAQLLAEGKTNKEVATILGIAVKTTETHRANIMLKLNLHSITDLVHYAIRNEMIQT